MDIQIASMIWVFSGVFQQILMYRCLCSVLTYTASGAYIVYQMVSCFQVLRNFYTDFHSSWKKSHPYEHHISLSSQDSIGFCFLDSSHSHCYQCNANLHLHYDKVAERFKLAFAGHVLLHCKAPVHLIFPFIGWIFLQFGYLRILSSL